jgi:hypothetical protein
MWEVCLKMYYIGKDGNLFHLIREGEKVQTTCGYSIRKLDLLMHKTGKLESRIVPVKPDNLPICKQCIRFGA